MSRRSKGPRLWFNRKRNLWFILDTPNIQRGTGCKIVEREEAENLLFKYIEENGRNHYVYFVTADAPDFPVKIGISLKFRQRINDLQTALPYEIQTLAIHPTKDAIFERRLHRKFDHLHIRGEWFRRTPELLAYIESLVTTDQAA